LGDRDTLEQKLPTPLFSASVPHVGEKYANKSDSGCLIVLIVLAMPTLVSADHNPTVHQLAWWDDAVGAGKIQWELRGATYITAINHADNAWSALGRVSIYQYVTGNSGSIDLGWYNYTNSTDGLCGYARNAPTGVIYLNTVYMDPANDFQEKSCAAHEFGHSLGIGDHGAGYSGALMYGHVGTYNTPQAHDREDYYARWP
jgi:hypothetical protein